MKFNKKIIAGIAAGIVLVGIVLGIKFIPQKTRDVNDADGRGTKQSEVQKDKDKENKTTQKDNNDKTEDKTKSEDKESKTEAKDKEETKTSENQKPTATNNNNNTNNGSQSSKGGSQSQTTAPPTTKHTHNYSIKGETVAPTYDADGYTVYKCSCGATTKGDWVQKLQKPTGYTEADAIRFRDEIEAYAVSKGYKIDRSLNADNSRWSRQWGISNGDYDIRMAQAKSEIDGPGFSQGSWNEYINVVYYQVEEGHWRILPYTF